MAQPTVIKGARTDNTADSPYSTNPTYYTTFASGGKFVPAATDLNGQATGTRNKLKVPSTDESEFPYHHWDPGSGTMKRIYGAGTNAKGGQGGNIRYVYWVRFVGDTASKVWVKVYDNSNVNTWVSTMLGGDGVSAAQAASKVWGVNTTLGLPGANDWIAGAQGKRLAGEDANDTYALALTAGALTGTNDLYWNMAIRIPAGMVPVTSSAHFVYAYSWN